MAALVGREDELETIALARRLFLVTGEAGTGKTRLVTQAARQQGAVTAEAACLPLDVRLPERIEHGLDLLGGCAVELRCAELFALGARAAADLAETARARRLTEAERAASPGPERAAHAAADRLRGVLDRMAGQPFTDTVFLASTPGFRADWEAELGRSAAIPLRTPGPRRRRSGSGSAVRTGPPTPCGARPRPCWP